MWLFKRLAKIWKILQRLNQRRNFSNFLKFLLMMNPKRFTCTPRRPPGVYINRWTCIKVSVERPTCWLEQTQPVPRLQWWSRTHRHLSAAGGKPGPQGFGSSSSVEAERRWCTRSAKRDTSCSPVTCVKFHNITDLWGPMVGSTFTNQKRKLNRLFSQYIGIIWTVWQSPNHRGIYFNYQ